MLEKFRVSSCTGDPPTFRIGMGLENYLQILTIREIGFNIFPFGPKNIVVIKGYFSEVM